LLAAVLPAANQTLVSFGQVVNATFHLKAVTVNARCALAWDFQPTAAKLGNQVRAIAAPGSAVDCLSGLWAYQQGLNGPQMPLVDGA
jgi:hypothetical protein